MKQNLFYLLFFNFIFFPDLKAQFSSAFIIDDEQEEFTSIIKVSDFNNDGKNDILTAAGHFPLDVIKIYFQGSDNQFTPVLIDEQDTIEAIDVADLNGDGLPDFAVISGNIPETALSWYENLGDSFQRHTLANVNFGFNRVILRDFNNDGMTDILSLEHINFVLRKAISPGVFDEGQGFADPTEYYAMTVNDYDNNGFLDVAVASATGFFVFLNDSGDSFTYFSNAGSSISFGLENEDLDQDGDIDIVSYDTLQGLQLYKNDGSGNFAYHNTIIDSTDNFSTFGLVDLNCDGIPDVHTVISQLGQAIWIPNEGAAQFGFPVVVHDFDGLVYASGNGDLNSDGAPDLIFGHGDLLAALNGCAELGLPDVNAVMVQIYPNPVQNYLYIRSDRQENEIQILDLKGRIIFSKRIENEKLDVNTLPNGIYYLRIKDTDQLLKFIKQ